MVVGFSGEAQPRDAAAQGKGDHRRKDAAARLRGFHGGKACPHCPSASYILTYIVYAKRRGFSIGKSPLKAEKSEKKSRCVYVLRFFMTRRPCPPLCRGFRRAKRATHITMDRSSFVGLGLFCFLKHAAEEAHDMRVFLPADKAHVRVRQHGMEEVAQFVILRIHAVLPEPDIHHARVVAQALDV